jgi:hypothetical protein
MSRRLFIGDQEINFFNAIGKELIQEIVGQTIVYYSVSNQMTNADDLYGEAMRKTVYVPLEINALVLYEAPTQTTSQFTEDTVYSIEIYFHLHELRERQIEPKNGDFVKFGENFYEVEELTVPDLVFGQIEHKVQVKARCRKARAGQFKIYTEEQ